MTDCGETMDLPHEKQFHFRDGSSVATLEQLKSKIESISYQEFYHHVNSEKNDFSAWVRHILQDQRLADDLKRVTSIVETVEILNDYLHPRSVIAPRNDVQSRIEQTILTTPLPALTDDITIEQVPTVTPMPGVTGETTDMTFEDELGEKAQEELFGKPAQTSARQAPQAASQPAPQAEHHDDMSRMIVKDFIFGLLFGLFIGLILGRILSL